MLSDRCLSCPVLSVCDVGVLWRNGLTDQDATYGDQGRNHWGVEGVRTPKFGRTTPTFYVAADCSARN